MDSCAAWAAAELADLLTFDLPRALQSLVGQVGPVKGDFG
ncbi:hypothetical protein P3T36_004590 [Kitasatospora sp. MAP12-15]|nr:hypothetical protein [Kitasatospora sp. MAP12-44]